MSHRLEQVSIFIRKEMAALLARSLELPAGAMATVTRVAIGPDLKFAKIYVNVLPLTLSGGILSVLNKKRGLLRQKLAGRMSTKFLPRISFMLDAEAAKRTRVEYLLDRLQNESSLSVRGEPEEMRASRYEHE